MKRVLICVLLLTLGFVSGVEYNRTVELDLPESGFVMRGEALAAINASEEIVSEMVENNFPVVGVSNDLAEAKEVFQMVDYSEILRDNGASAEDRWEAIRAIGDMDWSHFHYGDVLEYTNAIMIAGEKAFLSYESLILARVVYEERLEEGESVDATLIEKAESAFYEERWDEASSFALMAKDELELGVFEVSFFDRLKNGISGFFRAYWIYVLVLMIFLLGFFYKKIVGVFRGE